MEQIDGISSGFLALERPGLPMAVASVSIYTPHSENGSPFPAIRKTLLNAVGKYSLFRKRLLPVPGRLDHPYWVEDPDFDVDCHLRHAALARPGNWHQFYLQVARLQALPIPRDRPLWEACVIEGLDGLSGLPKGSFALVVRAHRAFVDSDALNRLLLQMHTLEPQRVKYTHAEMVVRENRPGPGQLLTGAVFNNSRRLLYSAPVLRKAYSRLRRQRKHSVDMPELPAVEPARFNKLPSGYRVVNHFTLSRKACEQVRQQVPGASISDVICAVVGGALRRYLAGRGQLPETSLVAACPARLQRDLSSDLCGAKAGEGLRRMALYTDTDNPLAQLRGIAEQSMAAAARSSAGDAELLRAGSEMLPPLLMNVGVSSYMRLSERMAPPYHTYIDAVGGVDVPVYLGGSKLRTSFAISPLMPACSLTHSVARWGDELTLGINACRDALPDFDHYQRCLKESWAALAATVPERREVPEKLQTMQQQEVSEQKIPVADQAEVARSA